MTSRVGAASLSILMPSGDGLLHGADGLGLARRLADFLLAHGVGAQVSRIPFRLPLSVILALLFALGEQYRLALLAFSLHLTSPSRP